MRRFPMFLVVIAAALAGVAMVGAPAVGQSSEEREVLIYEGDPICTPVEGAVGEHSMVCVLATQQTRGEDPLASSGSDPSLALIGIGFIGAGLLMRRASPAARG